MGGAAALAVVLAVAAFFQGYPLLTLALATLIVARRSPTAVLCACAMCFCTVGLINANIRSDVTTGERCDYDGLMRQMNHGSVARFEPEELKGEWWVRATTDPFVSSASLCNRLVWWIGTETYGLTWFSQFSIGIGETSSFWLHVSSPTAGELSSDKQRPGKMLENAEMFPIGPRVSELVPAVVLQTARDRSGTLQAIEMLYCVRGLGKISYNRLLRRSAPDRMHAGSAARAKKVLRRLRLNESELLLFNDEPKECDRRLEGGPATLRVHFNACVTALVNLVLATAVLGLLRLAWRP